jgi:hypothetical protein
MILLAFVLYGLPTENLIARRVDSIVTHYAPSYSRPLHVKSRFDGSAGVASISPAGRSGRWPFWEADSVRAVATGYLPLAILP